MFDGVFLRLLGLCGLYMEKCLFLLKCNGCGLCSGVLYSPEITVTPFPPSLFQWKVRRTLAFSIHELAVILGDQLTAADLVPIFNGFLKDLDEVRIGVLKHLYDFLKVSLEMCQLPGNQQTADKARVHCFLIFFFFFPSCCMQTRGGNICTSCRNLW